MAEHVGEKFSQTTIELDGSNWTGCDFVDCTIVYKGTDIGIERCAFVRCDYAFDGGAAGGIQFLKLIWPTPEGRKLFSQVVETVTGDKALATRVRNLKPK